MCGVNDLILNIHNKPIKSAEFDLANAIQHINIAPETPAVNVRLKHIVTQQ